MWQFPFVSGDVFRLSADWFWDETLNDRYGTCWQPALVKPCSVVFVKSDMQRDYFDRGHVRVPHVIVTHNSDELFPCLDEMPCNVHLRGDHDPGQILGNSAIVNVDGHTDGRVDNSTIFSWFGQNRDSKVPKNDRLHAVPIGIENGQWPGGDPREWTRILAADLPQWSERRTLLVISFSDKTNPERASYRALFRSFPDTIYTSGLSHNAYLDTVAHAKFVLSPPGNGPDCHRTWEAILMGAIPIVLSSGLDELYHDAPVLVVDSYQLVTETVLRSIRPSRFYHRGVCFANYWLTRLADVVSECRRHESSKVGDGIHP
jgi:hypothetical protein